ncbi:MAG TPA: hypothetical protein DCL43_07875, partial [Chitinophagaceae bacterium]|nr:hypothetical protein [Chitinophagaceae bacterium]
MTKTICISPRPNANFSFPNGLDSIKNCAPLNFTVDNRTDTGNCRTDRFSWQVYREGNLFSVIPSGSVFIYTNGDSTSYEPTFRFLQEGRYILRLQHNNNCGSIFIDRRVIVTGVAGLNMPGAQNYCLPSAINFANNINHTPTYSSSAGGEVYTWSVINPTGGSHTFIGGTNTNSQFPNIQFNGFGTFTVRVNFNNNCPGSVERTQSITFFDTIGIRISPTTVDTSICNLTDSIQLLPVTYGNIATYLWNDNAAGTFSSTNIRSPWFRFDRTDTANTVRLTVTATPAGNSPCTSRTATLNVRFKPGIHVSSVATKVICSGSSVNYTPTLVGGGGTFTYTAAISSGNVTGLTTSGTGSINDVLVNTSNTTNAIVTYIITPSKDGCNGTPFTFTVTVRPKPGITATAPAPICNGTQPNITLTNTLGANGRYTWVASVVSGTVSGFQSNNTPATAFNATTLNNSGTSDAIVRYVFTAINPANGAEPACTGDQTTVDVTVLPGASAANAGPDASYCNSATHTLAATAPTVGAGTWSFVGAATATISNVNDPNAILTGLQNNVTYTLRWTVAGVGSCGGSTDDVSVISYPLIQNVNAGADQRICTLTTTGDVTATLQGSALGTNETGLWTIITAPSGSNARFTNAALPNTQFQTNRAGIYTLRWTVSNPQCTAVFDEVTIEVFQQPVAGTLSPNSTAVCSGASVTLTYVGGIGAIGAWEQSTD